MAFNLTLSREATFANRNPNLVTGQAKGFFTSLEERRAAFRARMLRDFNIKLEF